jgi:RNA polymerase sigma-B factor
MTLYPSSSVGVSTVRRAAADDDAESRIDGFAHHTLRLRQYASAPTADGVRRSRMREELILAFMPVVRNIAGRYSGATPGLFDELVQVGAVGLILAVDRWDPDRAGESFLGYLVPCVRGEILHHFRDRTWSLHVPRQLKELSVGIDRATAQLSQQLGRAPRPSELAAHLDVELDVVLDALEAKVNHRVRSLDVVDATAGATYADSLGDLDKEIGLTEFRVAVRPLLAQLSDRDRAILTLRFFHDWTQTRIAGEFNLSQMHVSRILSQILGRLRAALNG